MLLASRISDLEDLDYLSVSVDGIDCYRELRGMDLQPVLEGIKAAKADGHQILMNCVISQKNLQELDNLVRLAEELGVYISFEPINESPQIAKEVWDELGIKDVPRYERAVQSLIEQKRAGAPIINSETYLKMIKSLQPSFRCHASEIILHVASDGTIENCRCLKEPLGKVSQGISSAWSSSKEKRKKMVEDCPGCLFFGYAENSLLYDIVPEVIAHYQWM
jgi:MoaA/NifB/PqqE/SkfB family radical SAM enzyme